MPEDRGEPWDMFDKEDMSDMFSRAMLEKMQLVGEYITVLTFLYLLYLLIFPMCRRAPDQVHLLRLRQVDRKVSVWRRQMAPALNTLIPR